MYPSEAQKPLRVRVSLPARTFLSGEPILLAYEVTNPSDVDRMLYLGRERDDWIAVALVDEDGYSAPIRTVPLPIRGGMHTKGARVWAQGRYSDALVITRQFQPPHVGRWGLHIGPRPSYSSLRPPYEAGVVPSLSFPLDVTAPNPARLREIAGTYRRIAAERQDAHHQHQDITALWALLSMPEQYALADWQALANIPHFRWHEALMKELARAMTPGAADILAQLWDPNLGPLLVHTLPAILLDTMYRAGDTMLRRHIEEIFARYGKVMPEHALSFKGA